MKPYHSWQAICQWWGAGGGEKGKGRGGVGIGAGAAGAMTEAPSIKNHPWGGFLTSSN